MYLCRCDCGNWKTVSMDQLRSGKTRSCGCLNREISSLHNTHDLTGHRFGRLTVLGRSEQKPSLQAHASWHCRCDCGNVIDVPSRYLVSGETRSCGCLRTDHAKLLQELDDQQFRVDGTYIPSLRSKLRSDNTTGVKGVSVRRDNGKYRAALTIRGERKYLGEFSKLADAARARQLAEERYFKPYLENKN